MGTTWWVGRLLERRHRLQSAPAYRALLGVLLQTAFLLLGLHLLEILVWALGYRLLPIAEITDFEQASYFSVITFTTVGYGDITLSPPWRGLAGVEALSGILLLGWSTALSFAVLQTLLREAVPQPSAGSDEP